MNALKENIILHVFDFIDTGHPDSLKMAKQLLEEFAKKYHVKLRGVKTKNTKQAFKDFITNNKGYLETIPKLYNSL